MAGPAYTTSTTRHSGAVGADPSVFTAETWTVVTIKVPSGIAGATYIYTDSSSKNEAHKPEPGDQITILLAPGTTLQLETDSGVAVEFSITMTEVPIAAAVYALDVIAFAMLVATKMAGVPVPEEAIVPPFRPEAARTSSRGPGRVYIDPTGRMTGKGGR